MTLRRGAISVLAAGALALASPPVTLETLKPPPGGVNEKGVTVASLKGGSERWRTEWTMQRSTLDGRPVVNFAEHGKGRYSPFDGPIEWNTESTWAAESAFRPLRIERTVTDTSGKQLLRERKLFDFGKGAVSIEEEGRTKSAPSRRSIQIPGDTIAVDGIAGALRSLPFDQKHPFSLHMLSNEPKLYEVSLEVRGRERVRTRAGDFECYKVELVPGLGALALFRFAIPKAYFWFTVDSPHFWVKYEGPENGRGTPTVVMELASFQR